MQKPSAAFLNSIYLTIALRAGIICFYYYSWIIKLSKPAIFFEEIELGLSCVVGAQKALEMRLSPVFSALQGMFTAVGGGAADIRCQRKSMLLHRDAHALAALARALLLTLGVTGRISEFVVAPIGAVLTTSMRLVALRYNWRLPIVEPDLEKVEGSK